MGVSSVAIAMGFGDITELNASNAFAPVHQRVDFQKLLAGLQAKVEQKQL